MLVNSGKTELPETLSHDHPVKGDFAAYVELHWSPQPHSQQPHSQQPAGSDSPLDSCALIFGSGMSDGKRPPPGWSSHCRGFRRSSRTQDWRSRIVLRRNHPVVRSLTTSLQCFGVP